MIGPIDKNNKLLIFRDVMVDKCVKLPDMDVASGEHVFVRVEHELLASLFVSALLGLIRVKSGKAVLAGKNMGGDVSGVVSYLGNGHWLPGTGSVERLVGYYAASRGLSVPQVYNEFCRLLHGLGAGYASRMNIKEMTYNTRKRVTTALTLSVPLLMMVLIEPFADLDNEANKFLMNELDRLSADGSSVIVLANEPSAYNFVTEYSFGGADS